MTRGFSPGGTPTAQVAAYYRRRASGGVGLVITEGSHLGQPSSQGYPDAPILAGDERFSAWEKVVDAVHQAGGKIFPQLWHTGSYCRPGFDRGNQITRLGPSPVAHPGYQNNQKDLRIPRRMTASDIEEVVASYAASARYAMTVGFDGVEIHGAHGYLVDQFLWELTNRRLDDYGGSLKERTRFACEVVRAVRNATNRRFPICFRFSNWKLNVYDERGRIFHQPGDLELFIKLLCEAGVDLFHASSRKFDEPAFSGSPLSLSAWTRRLSGKPTIAVGSVGLTTDFVSDRQGARPGQCSIARLEQSMLQKEFDLIAIGRSLLCDPDWVEKIRNHEDERIIPYDKSCLTRLY